MTSQAATTPAAAAAPDAAAAAAGAAAAAATPRASGDAPLVINDHDEAIKVINTFLTLSLVWSVGGGLDEKSMAKFSEFILPKLRELAPSFPAGEGWCKTCYDFTIRRADLSFRPWTESVPPYACCVVLFVVLPTCFLSC